MKRAVLCLWSLLSLALVILVVGAALPAAQTPSVMPGQWTLDVEKSTYSPGPKPKSQHAVLTAIPNGIRTVADRVEADGRMVHFEWSGTFDQKDQPVTGDPARDTVSVKKVDDYTLDVTNKKGGKVTTVLHSEYAKDGKTRVETITGTDAQGRAVKNVTYWTKQGAATTIRYPTPDLGVSTLAARAKVQRDTVSQFKVFYQFQFHDRLPESGITFFNHVVDDAAKFHKPVHYDHGTGIAVADVDGDGLEDIYFVNQLTGSQLWKNLGGGKFANITRAAGVALADRIGVAASFADIDNDGDQDLFVTTVRGGNVLFENDGKGHFKNISKAAGVDYVGHSSGAVFFDYDNDGLLDFYLCNVGRYTTDVKGRGGAFEGLDDAFMGHLHPDRSEHGILYRNLGHNQFKNVTAEAGLGDTGWSGDASVVDVNGDGFPDLYVLNMQGANHLYLNMGGKTFVDATAKYFPKTPWGAMGIKFFDYDNDGRPDLLITDMHSDMAEVVGPSSEKLKAREQMPDNMLGGPKDRFIFGNAFYANRGNGKFEEISDRVGAENFWPWGPSVADVNADGWQDVFIASSMNFPYRYGVNSLLLNNRGEKFLDSEFLLGIEPRRGGRTHTFWFDLDCSTDDPEQLKRWPNAAQDLCKGQTGKFTIMAPLGTRSSVVFDLNQDGSLDIVTNEFNSAPQVLVSDLAQKRQIHWLKVALAGTVSNRNGLGATVRVVSGGRTLTQWNDGKSGYLSQSVLPLYFGLGDLTKIDRVEVDWPSGRKQVVTAGLTTNSTLRVTEVR